MRTLSGCISTLHGFDGTRFSGSADPPYASVTYTEDDQHIIYLITILNHRIRGSVTARQDITTQGVHMTQQVLLKNEVQIEEEKNDSQTDDQVGVSDENNLELGTVTDAGPMEGNGENPEFVPDTEKLYMPNIMS